MKAVFINQKAQLRSGWKIFIAFACFFGLAMLIQLVTAAVIQQINHPMNFSDAQARALASKGIQALQLAAMFIAPVLVWKLLDKKSLNEMGFSGWKHSYKEFLFGFMLAALAVTLVFVLLLVTQNLSVTNMGALTISPAILGSFLLFALVGLGEETINRAYCISVLRQTEKRWMMIGVSALIFALLHGMNPDAGPLALLNLFLMGVMLAVVFIRSNSIAMPIGFHIAWNFFQTSIFGIPSSGMHEPSIIVSELPAYNVINGGAFGIENGLMATGVLLACMALILFSPKAAVQEQSGADAA